MRRYKVILDSGKCNKVCEINFNTNKEAEHYALDLFEKKYTKCLLLNSNGEVLIEYRRSK